MKKIILSIVLGGSVALLSSCNNEEHSKKDTAKETETKIDLVEKCSYSIDPTSLKLEWTSFKHTAKTPVGGIFDMMELNNTIVAETAVETFKNATISINSRTVNSKNEVRDEKIKNSFFGTMDKSDFLTGKIVSLEGEKNGNAVIAITMNGIEKEQNFKWTIEENIVEFKTELTIEDWSAKPSLDSLNTVCEDLHRGADGLSLLWPTVNVNITAKLNKECK